MSLKPQEDTHKKIRIGSQMPEHETERYICLNQNLRQQTGLDLTESSMLQTLNKYLVADHGRDPSMQRTVAPPPLNNTAIFGTGWVPPGSPIYPSDGQPHHH